MAEFCSGQRDNTIDRKQRASVTKSGPKNGVSGRLILGIVDWITVIPRNIFLMWDKPIDAWPALVRTCIDLWIEINPGWNVEVFDASRAQELISTDIDIEIYKSLKVQHQSDLVRTKLLGSRGGIWADASCLPHMPVDQWIGKFDDLDFSSIPSMQEGQIADNWFMLSRENGILMTKHYRTLVRYWATEKINLPQDPRSISMTSANWRSFISDYSAHTLRIAPYFCWQYLFRNQVDINSEFGKVFGE